MLNKLHYTEGSKHSRKRLGRGIGSGQGKTAGKGSNGQLARSGGGPRPGFEGGQIPFFQRIPKRGFSNFNRVEYVPVNLSVLEENFNAGDTVTQEVLVERGLCKKTHLAIKILSKGELTKSLIVKAAKFSVSAKAKIEASGGNALEI